MEASLVAPSPLKLMVVSQHLHSNNATSVYTCTYTLYFAIIHHQLQHEKLIGILCHNLLQIHLILVCICYSPVCFKGQIYKLYAFQLMLLYIATMHVCQPNLYEVAIIIR